MTQRPDDGRFVGACGLFPGGEVEIADRLNVLRKPGMRERGIETHYGRDMRVFVAEPVPA